MQCAMGSAILPWVAEATAMTVDRVGATYSSDAKTQRRGAMNYSCCMSARTPCVSTCAGTQVKPFGICVA